MNFVSLSTIVEDLLLIVRGSKLAASEKISKRQIEAWIHQYRALLIRQQVSSGDNINPDYIQTIPSIELVPIDSAGNITTIESGTSLYRTSSKIPKTVNMRGISGITFIGTLNKKRIQLVPGHRAEFQLYKKFTPMESIAYLEDEYIYLINQKGIRYITLRGIFENPVDAALYDNSTMTAQTYTVDSIYPIPINLIPALKQLILEREIGIESVAPGDTINDSKHQTIE
jgi:hypothetical protein